MLCSTEAVKESIFLVYQIINFERHGYLIQIKIYLDISSLKGIQYSNKWTQKVPF